MWCHWSFRVASDTDGLRLAAVHGAGAIAASEGSHKLGAAVTMTGRSLRVVSLTVTKLSAPVNQVWASRQSLIFGNCSPTAGTIMGQGSQFDTEFHGARTEFHGEGK
jgi:hypothetical protein